VATAIQRYNNLQAKSHLSGRKKVHRHEMFQNIDKWLNNHRASFDGEKRLKVHYLIKAV
jgi:hypothetical protein